MSLFLTFDEYVNRYYFAFYHCNLILFISVFIIEALGDFWKINHDAATYYFQEVRRFTLLRLPNTKMNLNILTTIPVVLHITI